MMPPTGSPCGECPFRQQALPGWLGASTPEEFMDQTLRQELPLPCHGEVNYERKDWRAQAELVHQCSGQAIFLANTGHLPRNSEQRRLPADRELVLANSRDFLQHHRAKGAASAPSQQTRSRGKARKKTV